MVIFHGYVSHNQMVRDFPLPALIFRGLINILFSLVATGWMESTKSDLQSRSQYDSQQFESSSEDMGQNRAHPKLDCLLQSHGSKSVISMAVKSESMCMHFFKKKYICRRNTHTHPGAWFTARVFCHVLKSLYDDLHVYIMVFAGLVKQSSSFLVTKCG